MVKILVQPLFVVLLFVLVRAGDLALSYAIGREGQGRSVIRAVLYGIVAVLALLAVLLTLFFAI